MGDDLSQPGSGSEPGFFESLRTVITDLSSLLETRLELASTEFEEEMERLKQTLVLGAIALFCAFVGVVLATIFVVALFWDTHPFLALGGAAVLYLAAGAIAALKVKTKAAGIPKLLSATVSEFAKDRERLSP